MSAVFSGYLKLHFSNHNICFNDMEISAHVFSPRSKSAETSKASKPSTPSPSPSPRFKTRCRLLKTQEPIKFDGLLKDSILREGGGCNTQEKLKTKIMQSFLGGGGGGKQDVLWEMWKWRIAYGCGVHLGLVFLLEAALFLRESNCSVIFLSFVRKLAVTKG